jgi:RNA polymerase sigma factor (sigma-70 family)
MSDWPAKVPLEALLSQAGWVRRLALRLTQDPDRAEDLVQDAWAIALERPPAPHPSGARAWLRAVLRNLERRRRRDLAIRAWHEAHAARREEARDEDDIEEQVLLQRRLADAILGLEEPYRRAIVLRYLQNLPPREVARLQGVSYDAARQRIARGVAMLRGRLDREYGDEPRAFSALCLAAWSRRGEFLRWLPLLPQGVTMMLQTKVLMAAGVVILAAFLVWQGVRPGSAVAPDRITDPSISPSLSAVVKDSQEEVALDRSERMPQAVSLPARAIDRDRDLHGNLINPSGEPIEGARIDVYRNDSQGYTDDPQRTYEHQHVAQAATDARGEFGVELPIGRPFDLEVNASSFARGLLGFRYAGERVTIQLSEGATLFGRVTRRADGSPVKGARLEASRRSGTSWHEAIRILEGETDADGRFRFENLPASPLSFKVTPRLDGAPLRRTIDLAPGKAHEENVVVEEGVSIRGRVSDAVTKEPIADAEVGETMWYSRSVRTDANGEYVYPGVRASGPLDLVARAQGYGRHERIFGGVSNIDDLPERCDFALLPGRRLRGRVLDSEGKAAEGAFVAAAASRRLDMPWPEEDWVKGRTDERGRFEIEGLRADLQHTLLVRKDGFGTVAYELPAAETESTVIDVGDIVLTSMAILRGSVSDQAGHAVPDWDVTLNGSNADRGRFRDQRDPRDEVVDHIVAKRTARTDDLGRFAFADLAAGEYRVETGFSNGGTKASKTVAVATAERGEGVRLVIPEPATIAGIVTDAEGRGLYGVGLMANTAESLPQSQAGALTDATGHFEIVGLPTGSYQIRVTGNHARVGGDSGESKAFLDRILTDISTSQKDLKIVLQPAEWLRGRVVDADGRGVEDAYVAVRVPGREDKLDAFTGAEGRFSVAVPEGVSLDLEAHPPRAPVGARRSLGFDLDAARAGRLSGVSVGGGEVVVKLPKQP